MSRRLVDATWDDIFETAAPFCNLSHCNRSRKQTDHGNFMLQSLIFNLRKTPVKIENALGVPYVTKSAVFLNIVQTAVDPPPPFVLNIAERIFV